MQNSTPSTDGISTASWICPPAGETGTALPYVSLRNGSSQRDEETKILILISDGQPADTDYYGTEAEADLRGIKENTPTKAF